MSHQTNDCPPEDSGYRPPYTVEGMPVVPAGDCTEPAEQSDSDSGSDSSSDSADDGIRTFDLDKLSLLCADIGLSPEIVEGVIAQLLIQHFSDPEWIIYPELKQLVWSASPALSGIQILPVNRWNELVDGRLPAIVFSNLGQRPQRITIGDTYAHTRERPGTQSFVRAYTGGHRLACIGENDFQAAQLATELERWFTQFSHHLVDKLPFHDFQVLDRQAPQAFTALGDRIGVALTLSYSYIWTWETTPYGAPLKSSAVLYNRPSEE